MQLVTTAIQDKQHNTGLRPGGAPFQEVIAGAC